MAMPPPGYACSEGPSESRPEIALRVSHVGKRFRKRTSITTAVGLLARSAWRSGNAKSSDGDTVALDRVSFTVRRGAVLGLLGPNGAGKTTLLRIIATVVTPDSGTVTVHGLDVAGQPALVRRLVAPAFSDERSLQWRLSALENLLLFARLHGLSRENARRRSGELLEIVGLEDVGDRMAGTFSSGMRQKLMLARALVGSPLVLLLDEPTRGLDPIAARGFRQFLRDVLSGQLGCTTILATHSEKDVLACCDHLAVLRDGCLVAAGPAWRLLNSASSVQYQLVVGGFDEVHAQDLQAAGLLEGVCEFSSSNGGAWRDVSIRVGQGREAIAVVAARLVEKGVQVAGIRQTSDSLADLIERSIQC